MVRTKGGRKVHVASTGSSRTVCGVRYAAIVRVATEDHEFCMQCGVSEGVTAFEMNQRYAIAVTP